MIDFRLLVKNGVHFGHQSSRWCPQMSPYIWGKKSGVHLIDISKTAYQLEKAAKFLEKTAQDGGTILWIGTKKPAQSAIKEAAKVAGMPSVTHRWIGGTLTNHLQVKKSITKFLHLQDVLKRSAGTGHYTKKELNTFQKRVERLEKNIGGIVKMKWPVAAIVVVDVRKEGSAVKEAAVMGIPIVALVDTNSNPSLVTHVIPANDDAPKSIKVLVDYLAAATAKGKEVADKVQKESADAARAALGEKKKPAVKTAGTSKVAQEAKDAKAHLAKAAAPKKAEAKVEAQSSAKTTDVKTAPKAEAKPAEEKTEAKK